MAISSAKAKTILKDGKANGKALSGQQQRFFGAVAGGKKPVAKAQEGAAVSPTITKGELTKAAKGAVVVKTGIPEGYGNAKDNIIHGMKDGGGKKA